MSERVLLAADDEHGQAQLTPRGLALLVGVRREELQRRWIPGSGIAGIPPEWVRANERRARAQAATGSDSMGVVLAWLVGMELEASVDADENPYRVWLIEAVEQ